VALARPNKQFNTALSLQTARVVLNDMSDGRSVQHDKVMRHAEVGLKPIRPSMTCFTLYVEYATSEITAAVVPLCSRLASLKTVMTLATAESSQAQLIDWRRTSVRRQSTCSFAKLLA